MPVPTTVTSSPERGLHFQKKDNVDDGTSNIVGMHDQKMLRVSYSIQLSIENKKNLHDQSETTVIFIKMTQSQYRNYCDIVKDDFITPN